MTHSPLKLKAFPQAFRKNENFNQNLKKNIGKACIEIEKN